MDCSLAKYDNIFSGEIIKDYNGNLDGEKADDMEFEEKEKDTRSPSELFIKHC